MLSLALASADDLVVVVVVVVTRLDIDAGDFFDIIIEFHLLVLHALQGLLGLPDFEGAADIASHPGELAAGFRGHEGTAAELIALSTTGEGGLECVCAVGGEDGGCGAGAGTEEVSGVEPGAGGEGGRGGVECWCWWWWVVEVEVKRRGDAGAGRVNGDWGEEDGLIGRPAVRCEVVKVEGTDGKGRAGDGA